MIGLGCKCPICGECGHTYVDGVCKYCGEKSPIEEKPEEHKCFAEVEYFNTNDIYNHDVVCAECGKFWKAEAHDMENGVCTACGYQVMFVEKPVEPKPEEPEVDDNKCTFGQHDQLMELGTKCPICGEWGKKDDDSDDAPIVDDDKCTFGQHDQMIELGCICPICGECGHTYEDGVCKYCGEKSPIEEKPVAKHEGCLKPEKCNGVPLLETEKNGKIEVVWPCGKLTFKDLPVHKCFAEVEYFNTNDIYNHDVVCAECGKFWKAEAHDMENGVCTACGYQVMFVEKPVEPKPEEPEVDDNKCTFGQHDQLMELGTKCPICGEWGKKDDDSDDAPIVDDDKCTFGQHDQMIELGCICPICGECGHTEVVVPGMAATCTEPGYTENVYCKYCDEVLAESTEIPALGHTENVVPGVAATCTEPGYTESKVCEVCGEVLVESELIPALGHADLEYECVDKKTHLVICGVCDEVVDVENHNIVITYRNGNEYHYCTDCDFTRKVKLNHGELDGVPKTGDR